MKHPIRFFCNFVEEKLHSAIRKQGFIALVCIFFVVK